MFFVLSAPVLADEYEIGPWRLGMSREEVSSFDAFGPYTAVEATGGIETENGTFEGNRRNVSFVFAEETLDFIQVWNYEGQVADVAKQRVLEIFDLFHDRFGGAEVENIEVAGQSRLDRGAMSAVLDKIIGTARELAADLRNEEGVEMTIMFDMIPASQPDGSRLHSMWGYSSRFDTFYVFLFQDPVDAPARRVEANVTTEEP